MKNRILAFLLVAAMLVSLLPVTALATEQTINDSTVTWEFSGGTLTIGGTGDMPDFKNGYGVPWLGNSSNITTIEIGAGVTKIGNNAFISCSSLSGVTALAVTPPTLGNGVFSLTENTKIHVPAGSVEQYKSSWSSYAGYIEASQTAHTHSFAEAWTTDKIGHWHECTAEDCDIKDYSTCGIVGAAYGVHDFTKGDCVCGAKAPITGYWYIDAAGEEAELDEEAGKSLLALTDGATMSTLEVSANWLYVTGNVTVTGAVTLNNDVNLILADGAKLEITSGISGSGKTLTVFGQTNGSGKLIVTGPAGATGAATQDGAPGGNAVSTDLTVNGGILDITGGTGGKGGTPPPPPNPSMSTSTEGGEGGTAITGKLTVNCGDVTLNGGAGGEGTSSGMFPGASAKRGKALTQAPVIADGYVAKAGAYTSVAMTVIAPTDDSYAALTEYDRIRVFACAPVSYIDAAGSEQQCKYYTVLEDGMSYTEPGWYYAPSGTVNTSYISTNGKGDLHIILADGAVLNVVSFNTYGLSATYEPVTNNIDIFGQENQTGQMNVTAADAAPGGTATPAITGGLNVYGGNVTVTGGKGGGTSNASFKAELYAIKGDVSIICGSLKAQGGAGGNALNGFCYGDDGGAAISGAFTYNGGSAVLIGGIGGQKADGDSSQDGVSATALKNAPTVNGGSKILVGTDEGHAAAWDTQTPLTDYKYVSFTSEPHTHDEDDITFRTAWSNATKLPAAAGSYYLTADVTLDETWNVPAGTTDLCLNGHVIKLADGTTGSVITVPEDVTLNLYDCGTTAHAGYVDASGLWHLDATGSHEIQTGETAKIINGGVITGGSATNGGGVYVDDGTFRMYGGNIVGNTAVNGGGVYTATRSLFAMPGGSIFGNIATTEGGGVYVSANACLAAGTMITMADGSRMPVESLQEGDEIRTFDHEAGTASQAKICFFWHYNQPKTGAFTLHFTHNIDVMVVDCHSFYEREANRYITVNTKNAKDYIGHSFYNLDADRWETLESITFENEPVETYVVATEKHLNCVAEGMLTCEDGIYTAFSNVFEFGEAMKVDTEKKAADIARWGIWTWDETLGCPKDVFDAHNLQYTPIAVGKGLIPLGYIEDLIIACSPLYEETTNPPEESQPALMLFDDAPLSLSGSEVPAARIALGGAAQITGNYKSTGESKTGNNLYLADGVTVTLGTGTGEGGNGVAIPVITGESKMSVGVTTQIAPTAQNPVTITDSSATQATKDCFTADSDCKVIFDSNVIKLQGYPEYPVKINGVQVNERNAADVLGNGKNEIVYDAVSKTLTFNDDCEISKLECYTDDLMITSGTQKAVTVTLTGPMLIGAQNETKTFTMKGSSETNTLTIKPKQTGGVNTFRPIAIRSGNTLKLEENVILTGSSFTGTGGGMINVASGATLDMQGGVIQNCNVISEDYDGANVQKGRGGAVYVVQGGKLKMSGGEIKNCSATVAGGAVYVVGAMEMTGGKIDGCSVSGLDDGSAVKAKGGAVYLYGGSSFTMTGGEISGNTLGSVADMRGAGVYAASGVSVMLGGTARIIDNTAGSESKTASNLFLNGTTAALGTGTGKPAAGMYVGLSSGEITKAGSGDEKYFFADDAGKYIQYLPADFKLVLSSLGNEYKVNIATCEHGTVYADPQATYDNTVYLTIFPEDGYRLKTLTVTRTGAPATTVKVNEETDTWYIFDMPEYAVTVTAVFEEIPPHTHTVGEDTITFDKTIKTFADLQALFANGGSGHLANDIKTTATLTVASDKTVDLCLNGYDIDASGSSGSVIKIPENATLNLYDCSDSGTGSISSGKAQFGGGVCVEGILNMYSGELSSCQATSEEYDKTNSCLGRGGAVYVFYNGTFNMSGGAIMGCTASVAGGAIFNVGTVNITGGKITGCSVSGVDDGGTVKAKGGAVYNFGDSTFTMTGGEITSNMLNEVADMRGAGVCAAQNANITLGGTARITDNINCGENETASNLFLDGTTAALGTGDNAPVTTGDKTMQVGVTMASPGKFAATETDYSACFASDDEGYFVAFNNNGTADDSSDDYLELMEKPHVHEFGYSGSGNVLTATCANSDGKCALTDPDYKLTLTLTAPASLVYDGNAKEYTFADGEEAAWTDAGLELPTIVYTKWNGTSYAAFAGTPTDAGSYFAHIYAGGDGANAFAMFTISRKSVTIGGIAVQDKTYNGQTNDAVIVLTNVTFTGKLEDDTLSISGITGEYDSADANDAQTVTLNASSNWTLDGDSAANYELAATGQPATATGKISKATPTVSTTLTATVTYGDAVSDDAIDGAMNVEGSFAWKSTVTSYGDATSAAATNLDAVFTPNDDTNYVETDVTVAVTVNKANYADSYSSATNAVASGNLKAKKNSTEEITLPDIPEGASYGNVTNENTALYTVGTIDGTTHKVTVTAAKDWDKAQVGTKAKTFTVAVTPDGNHNGYSITVFITPVYKTVVTITATKEDFTYGESDKVGYKDVSVTDDLVPVAELVATYYKETATAGQYETTGSTTVPTAAGNYKVIFSVPESNENYEGSSAPIMFTIAKADVTAPALTDAVTIDYTAETIAPKDGYEISTDSAFSSKITMAATIDFTKTYYIRKAEDANHKASAVTEYEPQHPAAPARNLFNAKQETIENRKDASIGGITAAMEYKLDSGNWTDGNGERIANPDNKQIYVRYKATGAAFHSEEQTVAFAASTEKLTVTVTDGTAQKLAYGDKAAKPADPTKQGYTFGGWYSDEDCTQAWSFSTSITADMTLYPKWIENSIPTAAISGKVTENNTAVLNATVELYLGTVKVAATVTDANGNYSFGNAENGAYNIVVTKADGKTKTELVTVDTTGSYGVNVELPEIAVSSVVEVGDAQIDATKSNISQTVVGGLDSIAASQNPGIDETITIKLKVEPKTDAETYEQKALKTAAGNGKKVEFLDLTLTKQINDATPTNIGGSNTQLLTIVIPFDFTNVDVSSVMILRHHGSAEKMTKDPTEGQEGFKVDAQAGTITIYAYEFSDYAISYEEVLYSGDGSYAVEVVSNVKNGKVEVRPKNASADQTVTITAKPDKGYTLRTLIVLDKNGREIDVESVGNNRYSFRMPASDVTVSATFTENNAKYNTFADVKAADYYYDAVLWAAKNSITKGTSDTTFSPAAPVTRAQVVTFLWRAAGSPEPKGDASKFVDVPANEYYAKAVAWAIEQGITKGTSATTFDPDATCTRGQIVTFLARFAGVNDADTESAFVDVDKKAYYAAAVKWAKDNKITEGTSTTTFSPDADCTRAQVVTFLYRWMVK